MYRSMYIIPIFTDYLKINQSNTSKFHSFLYLVQAMPSSCDKYISLSTRIFNNI